MAEKEIITKDRLSVRYNNISFKCISYQNCYYISNLFKKILNPLFTAILTNLLIYKGFFLLRALKELFNFKRCVPFN